MNQRTGSAIATGKSKNGTSRKFSHHGKKWLGDLRDYLTGSIYPWLLGGFLTLFLSFLMTAELVPPQVTYQAGDVVPRDIKAPRDMRVENPVATAAKQQASREGVLPRYDIDTKLAAEVSARIRTAFEQIRRTLSIELEKTGKTLLEERAKRKSAGLLAESEIFGALLQAPAFLKAEAKFQKSLGDDFPKTLTDKFREERYALWIRDHLIRLVREAFSREIISDRQLYAAHAEKGIIVRDIRTGNRVALSKSANPLELRRAEDFLHGASARLNLRMPAVLHEQLIVQAAKIVRPTLTFNNRATVEAQKRAVAKVEAVYQTIKEGEMIVREGERISENQLAKLKSLSQTYRSSRVIDNFVGTALVIFILLLLAWVCTKKYDVNFLATPKDVALFVILLIIQALLLKVGILFAHAIHESYSGVALTSLFYVIPFGSAALLAALLQGRSSALLMAIMSAVLTGMLLPGNANYSLITLAGGVLAAIRWKEYRHRSSILVAALIMGLIAAALALGFNMQEGLRTALARWVDVPIAFIGGTANVIVVSAAMPILESVFKLTTDMRLLELSDQNHPLLRQMVVRSPGTYHHSLLVGNLAEEAAEAIDANSLLARVGAYYHDIGKMLKPEYFVENQGAENRHDRLTPNMSALILISHVKEGIELAHTHKLPKEIIDLITQHHGTSLIRFFYEKAKAQKNAVEVREEAFRYPGPRPQTRDAGILMLADMVEASSRTLADNSPGRLSGLVERIVQSAFTDGQLDDCNITLRDLGRIQEAFLRVLAGIHHHRISYPDQPETEKRGVANGSSHQKPAKAAPARPESPAEADGSHPARAPLRR